MSNFYSSYFVSNILSSSVQHPPNFSFLAFSLTPRFSSKLYKNVKQLSWIKVLNLMVLFALPCLIVRGGCQYPTFQFFTKHFNLLSPPSHPPIRRNKGIAQPTQYVINPAPPPPPPPQLSCTFITCTLQVL